MYLSWSFVKLSWSRITKKLSDKVSLKFDFLEYGYETLWRAVFDHSFIFNLYIEL